MAVCRIWHAALHLVPKRMPLDGSRPYVPYLTAIRQASGMDNLYILDIQHDYLNSLTRILGAAPDTDPDLRTSFGDQGGRRWQEKLERLAQQAQRPPLPRAGWSRGCTA